MPMLYDEFKQHLLTFLWKQNDADLANSLDQLILMGTSELDRKLDIMRRDDAITLSQEPGTYYATLPADVKSVRTVSSPNYVYKSVTQAELMHRRIPNKGKLEVPVYSVGNGKVWFAHMEHPEAGGGDGQPRPREYTLTVRLRLPTFAAPEDSSWLADEYLDLYTYSVLKHSAPWLREDERIAVWIQAANDALTSVLDDDKFNVEWGGSPNAMSTIYRNS